MSALLPVAVLAGCSDWLTGPKLSNTPNAPVVAGKDPLLVAVGVGQTILQTGDLARTAAVWMDQMGGSDRQYLSIASYQFDEDAFASDWAAVYTGGGLVDIRSIEQQSLAVNDSLYAGIAKVWEAMTMGTAADWWGDIPYSQAVDAKIATPKLDPQQQAYAEVQASLDTAVDWLQCSAPSCQGPVNGADLFYGDNAANWLALAHTLKARYDMRVSTGPGVDSTAMYQDAVAQAEQGITSPSSDFVSYQSTNSNEWNLWYQFMVIQRSGYISAGAYLVNLLKSTNDPRLTAYFGKDVAGTYAGAPAGGQPGDWSSLSDVRLAPDFRQPIVTSAENNLILAEAAFRLGKTAVALAAYNAERAAQGVPQKAVISLNDILTEKYIADFQTMEPWNDYKRTCLPKVDIAPGNILIPGRVFYPVSTERNANPNIPAPSAQPVTNWNQPRLCPR